MSIWSCFSLMFVAVIWCPVQYANAQVPVSPVAQSSRSEIYLPDLPVPTQEQLRRGDQLLENILYVMANVPLTDAKEVLKTFGFNNMIIKTIPTYSYVYPADENGRRLEIFELKKLGVDGLFYQPWIVNEFTNSSSYLNIDFDGELCVSIESVKRFFQEINLKGRSSVSLSAHPVLRPRPLHDAGYLGFGPFNAPRMKRGFASMFFDYQMCARRISINYVFKGN